MPWSTGASGSERYCKPYKNNMGEVRTEGGLYIPDDQPAESRPLLIVPEGVSKRWDNKRPTQREQRRPMRHRYLQVMCGAAGTIFQSLGKRLTGHERRRNKRDGKESIPSTTFYRVHEDGSLRRQ
jgi:hypothetical protein